MMSNVVHGRQPGPDLPPVGFPNIIGSSRPGTSMSPLTVPSSPAGAPGSPPKVLSPRKGSHSPAKQQTPNLNPNHNLISGLGSPPQANASPSRQRIEIASLAQSQAGPSSLLTTAPPTSQSPQKSHNLPTQSQPYSEVPDHSQVNGIASTQSSGSGSATVHGNAEGDASMDMGEMEGDYNDNDNEMEEDADNVDAVDDDEEEGEEEEGEEEDDEEEEEEDDSEGDDKSEDLEGGGNDFEITGDNINKQEGLPVVKLEGTDVPEGTEAAPVDGEPVNVLVPKKRVRRARSEDDLPPPPPPMRTIRLERALVIESGDEALTWNILDDARDQGMVEDWNKDDDDADGMDVDGDVAPMPGEGGEVVGLGLGAGDALVAGDAPSGSGSGVLLGLDGDAEEIARRLEEKYGGASKKPKPKKKKVVVENYDLEDEFIDDSELTIDAPTHVARPKKEGFFVQQGPLELLEEEAPRRPARPAARRPKTGPVTTAAPRPSLSSLVAALPHHASHGIGIGTMTSPIQIDSDNEGEAGPSKPAARAQKSPTPFPEVSMEPVAIDRVLFKAASKDPAELPPFPTFPNEIRYLLMELREQSLKYHLRDPLRVVSRATFKYDMFGTRDEAFFKALPSIFPYNQFTLVKLAVKICKDQYWAWLEECEEEGVKEMAKLVEGIKESQFDQYEKAMSKWREEVAEWEAKHPNGVEQPNGTTPVLPSSDPTAMEMDGEDSAPKPEDKPREPPKRFYFSPDMKALFRQLLANCDEMSNFAAKTRELKVGPSDTRSISETSEKSVRQKLYKKMAAVFPDGFMTTSELSREMSRVKGNRSRQQQRADPEEK